jgi:hypothetical protein
MRSVMKILAAFAMLLAIGGTAAWAKGCPQISEGAEVLNLSASDLYTPDDFDVVAGGDVDLSQCDDFDGFGFVVANPDFSLNYTADEDYDLEFRATGDCDVVLLVNDNTSTWHFVDDTNGTDATLRLPNATDGRFDIWIGTYGEDTCDGNLGVETFIPASSPTTGDNSGTGECPQVTESTRVINHTARGLYTPFTYDVVAGGTLDLSDCADVPGTGYIISTPDFSMNYDHNQDYELEFRASGDCDVVLLVNDSSGDWHFSDDDGDGFDSLLRLTNPATGRYDVWVGTYSPETCDATLEIETF